MKVFIVPATYNEAENIEKFITILEEEVFPKIKDHDMHILVADDQSPDGTGDIIRRLMKKYKNLGVNEGPKKGLGAAYVRVMGYAIDTLGADVVMSIDADLQHDPHSIPTFLKKIEEGYDIVIGTRYSNGGSMPKAWPLQRKMFSVVANLLMRTITGRIHIHDWTGGYRAIKKDAFLKERHKMGAYSGYTFQVAFLYKAILDGFTIGEVPIHFGTRSVGDSKIAPLEYIINVLTYVILERIHELQRFIKFLVVGGTGFIMQVIAQEGSVAIGLALAIALGLQGIPFLAHSNISVLRDSVAAAIGAELAILSNFLFNNFWTFQDVNGSKKGSSFITKLIKFNLTSFAAIIIQFAAVGAAVMLLGDTMYLGHFAIKTRLLILFPTIIFLVIPLNYVIYNKIIWKTQNLKNKK